MNRAQMSTSHPVMRSSSAAKPKASAGTQTKRPSAAKQSSGRKSPEALLARVETVRLAQRQEGSFDCFATARDGYCDQGGCVYRSDCLSIAPQLA